jgi:tRNA pseudouridine55 synthase
VLPVQAALADIPALELTENEANCLRHGQTVATPYTGNGLVCAMQGSRLVAMAEADGVQIRPRRVFNF